MPKNPNAVSLGKLGGKQRAKVLSAARRAEIASKAAKARWSKRVTTRDVEDVMFGAKPGIDAFKNK